MKTLLAILITFATFAPVAGHADPIRIEWHFEYAEPICGGCQVVTLGVSGTDAFESYQFQRRLGPGPWEDWSSPFPGTMIPGGIVGQGFVEPDYGAAPVIMYRVKKVTP